MGCLVEFYSQFSEQIRPKKKKNKKKNNNYNNNNYNNNNNNKAKGRPALNEVTMPVNTADRG
jgi:hypothetical protein